MSCVVFSYGLLMPISLACLHVSYHYSCKKCEAEVIIAVIEQIPGPSEWATVRNHCILRLLWMWQQVFKTKTVLDVKTIYANMIELVQYLSDSLVKWSGIHIVQDSKCMMTGLYNHKFNVVGYDHVFIHASFCQSVNTFIHWSFCVCTSTYVHECGL